MVHLSEGDLDHHIDQVKRCLSGEGTMQDHMCLEGTHAEKIIQILCLQSDIHNTEEKIATLLRLRT